MLSRRFLLGASRRLAAAPVARSAPRCKRYSSSKVEQFQGAEDNEFNRERAKARAHAGESGAFWEKLCLYVALPFFIVGSVNAKLRWDAHWEHMSHEPPVEERTEYPYMNIRTKTFWWGDGDKTLFWNPKVNHHKKD